MSDFHPFPIISPKCNSYKVLRVNIIMHSTFHRPELGNCIGEKVNNLVFSVIEKMRTLVCISTKIAKEYSYEGTKANM